MMKDIIFRIKNVRDVIRIANHVQQKRNVQHVIQIMFLSIPNVFISTLSIIVNQVKIRNVPNVHSGIDQVKMEHIVKNILNGG